MSIGRLTIGRTLQASPTLALYDSFFCRKQYRAAVMRATGRMPDCEAVEIICSPGKKTGQVYDDMMRLFSVTEVDAVVVAYSAGQLKGKSDSTVVFEFGPEYADGHKLNQLRDAMRTMGDIHKPLPGRR
ncbi:hypothetical protein ACFLQN_04325 [Candidatus Aenigmatarchaeota archaeon]